ncbi:hypothetical protein SDRG_17439, partial [Saprolegnia diclina VS20]
MELSHMVVDDVGDADSFHLQPSDNNATTFGMLIVLLPSAYTGGVLTFTHSGHSQTFGDDMSLLETSFAASYLSTAITSAPITSGRRAALVYRLFYRGVEDEPLQSAEAAFRALGQSTTQEVQRLGLELDASLCSLSFANLSLFKMGLVNALLAAGNFDIGLATLAAYEKGQVQAFKPHPACNIPDAVGRGLIGRPLDGFLYLPPPNFGAFDCPLCAIVFWPKRHRVGIVDIVQVLDFVMLRLERGDDDDDGYLGISDSGELLLGAVPYFVLHGPSLAKPKGHLSKNER